MPDALMQGSSPGRDRLVPNVLSSWLAHGVALVIGFVMPRLIDESVGQVALGVWDLGWSLVHYVAFSGLGMAAAITHDVARFYGSDATSQLRISVTSGLYCQLGLAALLGSGLVLLFAGLPALAPESFAAIGGDMRWVGTYLGLAVVVALIGDVAQGILTGYHRNSWNEYLTIAADVTLALAMILVLVVGGGIVGLALVTFLVRAAAEIVRIGLAAYVCPQISLGPWLWDRSRAAALLRFAAKTSLGVIQELLVHQGIRVLLAAAAGPGVLAVYSRYQTVIRQITRLMERSVRVIPPMASDLHSRGHEDEVLRLREKASRATALAALPMICVFAVFGDELVLLWMGPEFVAPGIAWVLSAMALMHLDYGVSSRILAGLNAHGRILACCCVSSLLLFVVLYLVLHPLHLLEAAWMAALTMGLGVSLPHYLLSCARLGTPPGQYFRRVYLMPVAANLVFLAGLVWAHDTATRENYAQVLLILVAASAILSGLYWRFGLPAHSRQKLVSFIRGNPDHFTQG